MQPFTLLIKPSGSNCNVDCTYCFYKARPHEIGKGRQRMSGEVLEKLVKDYLSLRFDNSAFAWQGGEPMLMGLDFYKKVVELQKKYGQSGQVVANALQTNGVLLDEQWCRFLSETSFLVGISVDGPKEYHDHYRLDHKGEGTFEKVMAGINKCKQFGVEFNTLTLLNNLNVGHPDELFEFFIENEIKYLQFIPCIEIDSAGGAVKDYSITPEQYGDFLCRLFDRWYEYGPEKLSIRDFDSVIQYCLGGEHTICTFGKQCAGYIVIEHSGEAYCCDFFVEPKWHLGSIMETPIEKLAASSKKRTFSRIKQNLCNKCMLCRHLAVCRGGCMKDRAPFDKENYGRESYFCEGYKKFFDHTMPRFTELAASVNPALKDRI